MKKVVHKGTHILACTRTRKWCWRCSHHNFMHCFVTGFRLFWGDQFHKIKELFLFTFKGHKSNSQEKKKDPFIHTRSYNSEGKAIFSSQRLAGQERGKTAEMPVHLEDHSLNSPALLTTVPSLDFESRTIKSST